MNNKVKECNIDFVIDKTPPTVVITGIEESSYRADEREMTINLSDNTAVKSVDVIIDGKSVATYAQKEIEKAGGKISYMIEGASEPQKIEAAALDMAGNETTSEMHKVLVTSSVWIQYINNTPLLIGSIPRNRSRSRRTDLVLCDQKKERRKQIKSLKLIKIRQK